MEAIHVVIRPFGNSKGVVLPKPVLVQAGFVDATDVELTVENGAIVLRKPVRQSRAGWAEAAHQVASTREDALVLGEFGNESNAEIDW